MSLHMYHKHHFSSDTNIVGSTLSSVSTVQYTHYSTVTECLYKTVTSFAEKMLRVQMYYTNKVFTSVIYMYIETVICSACGNKNNIISNISCQYLI